MPFRMTTSMLASCTNIPTDIFIHSLNIRLDIRRTTTPTAIAMFCFMFRAVALARPRAWGSLPKSEFMRTTSDVSIRGWSDSASTLARALRTKSLKLVQTCSRTGSIPALVSRAIPGYSARPIEKPWGNMLSEGLPVQKKSSMIQFLTL